MLAAGALGCSAASLTVNAGGDLQAAFNQARGGDTITLAAGAAFTGHFQLAANSGATITIQSSQSNNLAAGQRVSPGQAGSMAKLVTPDASQVLRIPAGANNYQIIGLEFTENPGVYVQDLVQAGSGGETSTSQLPQNIVFDRVYVHGDRQSGGKRGLALNSGNTTIKNSYFADFISTGQDTQAICGWNGTGPFLIDNNHLESGTEIVAFGGATPAISGLIPSNITIQNNEFFKPTRYFAGSSDYAGIRVWAKNHLELKNAQHVTIQNNTFTNNFVQADQLGFALVLNVRDQDGQVPWATVNDVTVSGNTFQHTAAGVLLMGHDGDGGGTAGNFTFRNNLWTDLGVYGGDGRLYEILNDVRGVVIDHDTAFPAGWLFVFAQGASSGLHVTNSIYANGWDIAADGGLRGNAALNAYEPDSSFTNNLVIGGNSANYSGSHFASNLFPSSPGAVGFVGGGNYNLAATSPYHGIATDGKDPGASFGAASSVAQVPSGWVKIISKQTGQCLADPGGSLQAGTQMIEWTCNGYDDQNWQFAPVSGGYKITSQHSGLQLDIAGISASPGAALTQWPYWGGANEIYLVTAQSDGSFTLQPTHNLQYLAVPGGSLQPGTGIIQWPATGGDEQKWRLVP